MAIFSNNMFLTPNGVQIHQFEQLKMFRLTLRVKDLLWTLINTIFE